MFRVCMSVCLPYETACKAGLYVCKYGAILRIRRTEEYQSVGNKQAGRQQQMLISCVLFSQVLDWVKISPNTILIKMMSEEMVFFAVLAFLSY